MASQVERFNMKYNIISINKIPRAQCVEDRGQSAVDIVIMTVERLDGIAAGACDCNCGAYCLSDCQSGFSCPKKIDLNESVKSVINVMVPVMLK